jgi:hypothetical protein
VRIREKVHRYFTEHLYDQGVASSDACDMPEALLLEGNCIARALWHLSSKTKALGRVLSSWGAQSQHAWLAACITLHGHRFVIPDQTFYLARVSRHAVAVRLTTFGRIPGHGRQVEAFIEQSQHADNVTAAARGYRTYAQACGSQPCTERSLCTKCPKQSYSGGKRHWVQRLGRWHR